MEIRSIWDGPEVVISGLDIQRQKLQMAKLSPPSPKEALDYALEQMNPAEAVTQQLRQTRDTAAALAALEPRREAGARFALGCLLTAEGRYAAAMERFRRCSRSAKAYEQGHGVAADVQEAKRWFRLGSNAGHAEAMFRLAALYERMAGASVDTEQLRSSRRTIATRSNFTSWPGRGICSTSPAGACACANGSRKSSEIRCGKPSNRTRSWSPRWRG